MKDIHFANGMDPAAANGPDLLQFRPDFDGFFGKGTRGSLHHVDHHVGIEGDHGLLADPAVVEGGGRGYGPPAGNLDQPGQVASLSGRIETSQGSGHPVHYTENRGLGQAFGAAGDVVQNGPNLVLQAPGRFLPAHASSHGIDGREDILQRLARHHQCRDSQGLQVAVDEGGLDLRHDYQVGCEAGHLLQAGVLPAAHPRQGGHARGVEAIVGNGDHPIEGAHSLQYVGDIGGQRDDAPGIARLYARFFRVK